MTPLLLFYLAGPLLMLTELLQPLPAALLLLAAILGSGALAFELPESPSLPPRGPHWKTLFWGGVFVLLTVAWIVVSGMGGVAHCRYDYLKHLVIFGSLLQDHLPVAVTDPRDGSQQLLHYYFAYYITPVRLSQLTQGLWSALDLDLVTLALYIPAALVALRLLARLAGVHSLALLCLVVLLGGFDFLGLAAFDVQARHWLLLFGRFPLVYNLEWWGVPQSPQSFTAQLYWAPQHFFAALLGLPLLLAALRSPGRPLRVLLRAGLVLAAALLWSPYVAIGLAAVGAAELLLHDSGRPQALLAGGAGRALLAEWRPALAVLLLGGLSALYLVASQAAAPPRPILAEVPLGAWALTFLLNHGPFLVAAGAALWAMRTTGSTASPWWPAAQVLLLGLLLELLLLNLVHGRFNDWGLRTTLPVLLWMALPLCRLLAGALPVATKALLFLAVGLSAASSVMEIGTSIEDPRGCPDYDVYGFEALEAYPDQYLGEGRSLFYRWLARLP